MSVDIIIMAHADREEQAIDLATELGAYVVWDGGMGRSRGENATGDRAWSCRFAGSDWVVVLQDDAIPVPNLRQHLQEGLAKAPRTCVGLYVGTSYPRPSRRVTQAVLEAQNVEASWLEHGDLLWGVGVAMPIEHIEPMLAFVKGSGLPYDRRIGAYFRSIGLPVRYTFPSLVDHRDGLSLLNPVDGPRELPRVAYSHGVPEWNERVVKF